MDKNLFLKNMEEMIAIAKTNGNQIDHKELLDYFSDYNLNEEAKKLLIASFIEAGIRVLGVDEAQIVAEEEAEAKANVSEEEQGAIRFYEEELSQMDLPGEEEQKELITSWLADKEDGEAVIESFLPQILEIARNHMGKGVLFGDLVQEGNIGLLEAMAIYQDGDAEGFLAHAKSAVEDSILDAIALPLLQYKAESFSINDFNVASVKNGSEQRHGYRVPPLPRQAGRVGILFSSFWEFTKSRHWCRANV